MKLSKEAFQAGMLKLAACFPNRALSADDVALRQVAYYEAIGPKLSDSDWRVVVNAAIAGSEFFPTVAALLDLAPKAEFDTPYSLPWKEQRRAQIARNAQRQIEAPREEWKPEPPRPTTVTAHEDRMALLRKQAEMLKAES